MYFLNTNWFWNIDMMIERGRERETERETESERERAGRSLTDFGAGDWQTNRQTVGWTGGLVKTRNEINETKFFGLLLVILDCDPTFFYIWPVFLFFFNCDPVFLKWRRFLKMTRPFYLWPRFFQCVSAFSFETEPYRHFEKKADVTI